MIPKIESAIKVLAGKVTTDTAPEAALKYTQAVLNLAHAKATLVGAEQLKK